MKNYFILILIFVSQIFCVGYAQDRSVISDSIYSDILKEQRSIKVILPETYKPGSNEKYEVFYITDGEWATELFPFIHKFLRTEYNNFPEAIIITIPNTYINGINQRDRDLMPEKDAGFALSGGADNFLLFLKNELIPYVNKKYPSNGTNNLCGHSSGGMFAVYVLLKEPQLFESYIATDPAFWLKDGHIIKLVGEKIEKMDLNRFLWIAGIESTYKNMGIEKMDSVLKLKAPDNLRWKVKTFPNETHSSVRLKGYYDGLKYLFSGYTNYSLRFHPMNGILLKNKPMSIFIPDHGVKFTDIKYTLNGSEPNKYSPVAEQNTRITAPAQLVMKSFAVNNKYDQIFRGNFEIGEPLPPISRPKNIKAGGLKYSYYEGDWEKLPDFGNLVPVKSSCIDSIFQINRLPGKAKFACLFEGYIEVPDSGYYVFAVASTGGSRLFLKNNLIIETDCCDISAANEKSYVLPLVKGFYPIRLELFQKTEAGKFQFLYLVPDPDGTKQNSLRLYYKSDN